MKIKNRSYHLGYQEAIYPDNINLKLLSEDLLNNENQFRIKAITNKQRESGQNKWKRIGTTYNITVNQKTEKSESVFLSLQRDRPPQICTSTCI